MYYEFLYTYAGQSVFYRTDDFHHHPCLRARFRLLADIERERVRERESERELKTAVSGLNHDPFFYLSRPSFVVVTCLR